MWPFKRKELVAQSPAENLRYVPALPAPETDVAPLPALNAAISLLSDALASLEIGVYTPDGERRPAHPVDRMLNRDTALWPAWARREHVIRQMLTWGCGYFYMLNPDIALPVDTSLTNVRTIHDPDGRVRVVYDVVLSGTERRLVDVPRSRVVGIYADGYDGVRAPSPVQLYAGGTLGVAQQAALHLQRTLKQGSHVSGTVESPADVGEGLGWSFERIQALRERLEQQFFGNVNAGRAPVLPPGWSFKPAGYNAVDMALIDLLKFSVEDVCRIYRVPPVRLYHYLSGRFAEENERQNAAFASWSLAPRARAIEAHLTAQLLADSPLSIRIDEGSVGAGTLAERVAAVDQAVARAGVMTINEGREYIATGRIPRMLPIEDGDRVLDPKGAPEQGRSENGDEEESGGEDDLLE